MTKDNWIKAEWDNFETRFWDYVCEESAYGETDVDNKRLKEIFLDAIEKTKRKCEDLHKNDPTPEDIRELVESVEKETVEKTNKRWRGKFDDIKADGVTRLECGCEVMKVTLCDKHAGFIPLSDLLEDKHED